MFSVSCFCVRLPSFVHLVLCLSLSFPFLPSGGGGGSGTAATNGLSTASSFSVSIGDVLEGYAGGGGGGEFDNESILLLSQMCNISSRSVIVELNGIV
jgi:hypothetical protein